MGASEDAISRPLIPLDVAHEDAVELAVLLTDRARSIGLGFPGTMEKLSHGEPTYFVKGNHFANMVTNHHNSGHIAVHCGAPSKRPADAHRRQQEALLPPVLMPVAVAG